MPAASVTDPKASGKSDNKNTQTAKRLNKTTACLPFVYGSVAFFLGKKADEFNTHQWTLYLRGPNNEDLSGVISKVIFQLHASFAQPIREIQNPPFEVCERGWGEFEAQIRIIWKDPLEKPTLLTHGIKLYPPGPPGQAPVNADADTPVVSESYDEAVFTDPTETFYNQLLRISNLPAVHLKEERAQAAMGQFSDEQDFRALLEAQKFLQSELTSIREHFQVVERETAQVDEALKDIQEKSRSKKVAKTSNPSKTK